jgi:hypothetical protein
LVACCWTPKEDFALLSDVEMVLKSLAEVPPPAENILIIISKAETETEKTSTRRLLCH